MPFVVGESIGPYRLLEQLGQGGMATVYKAYHAALDRYVAIKALHPAFTQESNFLARFRREAQVVAKLEHANIVPIYDYSEHEGRPYLVMKFIEGETLKARLSRGMLGQDEISQIVESVGAALEYAHQQGVLHRDVKPSNVLLASDGRIYLADFGLARIASAGESTISSDVMLGTPQYISPEQAMGQRDLDAGTDIYSFGVLLYELLVGRVPYSADTPYSIIHDHIYAQLPLPRNRNPDIPEMVELVLLKALAKNRADRFTSLAALVDAWKKAVQVPAPLAPPQVAPATPVELLPASELPADSSQLSTAEVVLPVGSTVLSEPAPTVPPAEAVSVAKKGKRLRWWMVVGGILLLCLCLFLIATLRNQGPQGRLAATRTAIAAQTQAAAGLLQTPGLLTTEQLPTQPSPISSTQTESPTPGDATAVEAIKSGILTVTAQPDDPYAHFELAKAYWEAGLELEGERALNIALRTARDNLSFYKYAGDYCIEKEWWLRAARVYFTASRFAKEPQTTDFKDKVRFTLYMAAQDPQASMLFDASLFPSERIGVEMMDVVRARHALYQGNLDQAKSIIAKVKEKKPDMPELRLLEAELLVYTGEKEAAKDKLEVLVQDSAAPQWVKSIAQYFLNELTK